MPRAARVIAVHKPNAGTPFDRLIVSESESFVLAVQERFEGDLGWVPGDLTFADASQSLAYDVRVRRGVRSNRLLATGTTRIDGLATPYAWVRLIPYLESKGAVVRTEVGSGGISTVSVVPESPHLSAFECEVDTTRKELIEVRVGQGDRMTRFRYSDWAPLDASTHMPRKIEFEYPSGGPLGRVTKVYEIKEARTLGEVPVAPPALPAEAIIDDQIAGKLVRGDGSDAGASRSPTPASAPALPWLNRNTALVGVGVALVVVAGVIARKRRTP